MKKSLSIAIASVAVACASRHDAGALVIAFEGDGRGAVEFGGRRCEAGCTEAVAFPATLVAIPDSSSRFDGWSGDCSGTGQCTVSAAANVRVRFVANGAAAECPSGAPPPSKIANVQATPSPRSADLSWQRPQSACPITGYQVTVARPSSQDELVETTEPSASLKGYFAPAETPCFRVAARSARGLGEASERACVWIPSSPRPVINFTAAPEGGNVRLRWTDQSLGTQIGTPFPPGSEPDVFELRLADGTLVATVPGDQRTALVPPPLATARAVYQLIARNASGTAQPRLSNEMSMSDAWKNPPDVSTDTRAFGVAAAVGSRIFLLGASLGEWLNPAPNLSATVSADGTLGPLGEEPPVPSRYAYAAAGVFLGTSGAVAFQVGGYLPAPAGNTTDVWTSTITSEGHLGPWVQSTPLPEARAQHTACAVGGWLYVLGGLGPTPVQELKGDVSVAPLHDDGTVGPWRTTTGLPAPWHLATCATDGVHLYLTGGSGVAPRGSVIFATVGADGSLSNWTETTAQPAPRMIPAPVVSNGRLYLFGGERLGEHLVVPGNTSTVESGDIDPTTGDIRAWTPLAKLPGSRDAGAAAIAGSHAYFFAGYGEQGVALRDVLVAGLDANGALARRQRSAQRKALAARE